MSPVTASRERPFDSVLSVRFVPPVVLAGPSGSSLTHIRMERSERTLTDAYTAPDCVIGENHFEASTFMRWTVAIVQDESSHRESRASVPFRSVRAIRSTIVIADRAVSPK